MTKRRREFEDGMNEELRFHIETYTDELIRSGVPEDEARRRARIEFGGLNTVQGECRESRRMNLFDELSRELRHAARLLRKTPGFTITALLTLAVCFGANLTIFAALDSILLRALPFPNADRLVTMFNTYPKAGVERDGSSTTNYYERRGHIPAFASLSLYAFGTAIVGEQGATQREQITRVSPEFFTTLGVGPALGRAFTEEETTYKTDDAAILTDGYWREHFNADPQVIGKHVRVDGVSKTVAGVLPPNFRFLSSDSRLYFPFASSMEDRGPLQRHSGGNSKQLIARLKPGATIEQAQAQIDAQNNTLELTDPQAKMVADAGFRSVVTPLHADHVASIRPILLLLQAGVLTLLLIGAVNLANLLLIRANGRVKEIAIRQALGASRGHLASEVMVETLLLAVAGGLLGLAVGAAGIRLLALLGTDRLPLGSDIIFNGRLALAALGTAIVMGIGLAVPVIWFHLRRDLGAALQSESRSGTSGRAAQALRHGFVVCQIALAVVLLAGAGLLGLSLKRALAVAPGFRADHVVTGKITTTGQSYPTGNSRVAFAARLAKALESQPGVTAAGIATNIPLSGNSGKSAATVIGHVLRPGESARGHYSYAVDGDYFDALGFSLKTGRFLNSDDSQRGNRVCVVDEDFARYYWPDANPIGQRLFEGSEAGKDQDAYTVVGVVGSAKQAGLTENTAQGAVYYPYAFRTEDSVFVVVRTGAAPELFGRTLQQVVRQMDADMPVNDLRSMDTRVADSLVMQRSPALLAGLFSGIALLLTVIGAYGVLSYAVSQRQREIGIRTALGARPDQIRNQFLSLAGRLLVFGAAFGLIGAWLTGRAMQAILFDVPALSPGVLLGATGVMAVAALAACLLPALRAARVSPMEALSQE